MAPLDVHIKHAGKTYDVQLDPNLPPAAFKHAVYQLTGVPPDRMKVMIKGGMLKVSLSRFSLSEVGLTRSLAVYRTTRTGKRSHRKRWVLAARIYSHAS